MQWWSFQSSRKFDRKFVLWNSQSSADFEEITSTKSFSQDSILHMDNQNGKLELMDSLNKIIFDSKMHFLDQIVGYPTLVKINA